jgi:hypothetical protein
MAKCKAAAEDNTPTKSNEGFNNESESRQPTPPTAPSNKRSCKVNTIWTADDDTLLLSLLLEIKEEGGMSDNGFKDKCFNTLSPKVEAKCTSGSVKDGAACKTCLKAVGLASYHMVQQSNHKLPSVFASLLGTKISKGSDRPALPTTIPLNQYLADPKQLADMFSVTNNLCLPHTWCLYKVPQLVACPMWTSIQTCLA